MKILEDEYGKYVEISLVLKVHVGEEYHIIENISENGIKRIVAETERNELGEMVLNSLTNGRVI